MNNKNLELAEITRLGIRKLKPNLCSGLIPQNVRAHDMDNQLSKCSNGAFLNAYPDLGHSPPVPED